MQKQFKLRQPEPGDALIYWVLVELVIKSIYEKVQDWECTDNSQAEEGCMVWVGAGANAKAVVNRPWVRRLSADVPVVRQIYVREFIFELTGHTAPIRGIRTPTLVSICGCHECMSPDHAKWLSRSSAARATAERTQYGKDPVRAMRISRARQEYNRRMGVGLTPEQVNTIRANPGIRPTDMAKRLGVKAATVAECRRHRSYKLTQDEISSIGQGSTATPSAPFAALLSFAMAKPASIARRDVGLSRKEP